MVSLWLNDIESLEAISQDDEAKQIFLRMAALSRDGQMGSFLTELARDEATRAVVDVGGEHPVQPGPVRPDEALPGQAHLVDNLVACLSR